MDGKLTLVCAAGYHALVAVDMIMGLETLTLSSSLSCRR